MNRKIVAILSLIIGGEACVVMAGWIFHLDYLTRFLTGEINMKFPTAFLFLISAMGLHFISKEWNEDNEWSHLVLPGISLFIFLISSVLLVASFFSVTTGMETLFVQEGASPLSAGSGWPSIPTLISFILFGTASLSALFVDSAPVKIQFFGYSIFAVGLLAVVGYAFHLSVLYYKFSANAIPMAPNTAFLFVLLGLGLVLISKTRRTHEV